MSDFKNFLMNNLGSNIEDKVNQKSKLEADVQYFSEMFCKHLKEHIKKQAQEGKYKKLGEKSIIEGYCTFMYYGDGIGVGNFNYLGEDDTCSCRWNDVGLYPSESNIGKTYNGYFVTEHLNSYKKGTGFIHTMNNCIWERSYELSPFSELFINKTRESLKKDEIEFDFQWVVKKRYFHDHPSRFYNHLGDIFSIETYNTKQIFLKQTWKDSVGVGFRCKYKIEI